jgi:hypothetical protein
MTKPIVFISHITEEKELAVKLKRLIETSFLGMIEVFVSSDEHSAALGSRWLDNISDSLKNCSVELILCSQKSISRPWINFEAGAGWVRGIPVIPLCHSGMKPAALPIPLNLLQAATISEISSLKLILPVLAQSIGAQIPNVNFSDFVDEVRKFEENYTFWDECNEYFGKIDQYSPEIIPALKQGISIQLKLTETERNLFDSWMQVFFTKHNLMSFNKKSTALVLSKGICFDCFIVPNLNEISRIFEDTRFKY